MDAMRDFQRFGLVLNDQVVRTPVAIASMAGVVDADYWYWPGRTTWASPLSGVIP